MTREKRESEVRLNRYRILLKESEWFEGSYRAMFIDSVTHHYMALATSKYEAIQINDMYESRKAMYNVQEN